MAFRRSCLRVNFVGKSGNVNDKPLVRSFGYLVGVIPGFDAEFDPPAVQAHHLRDKNRAVIPIGVAARCSTFTCVPTVSSESNR